MNDLDFRDARVLIIDDQDLNIAMLSGMLKKHGFRQRFSANDPFAGIEMFQRVAPISFYSTLRCPDWTASAFCPASGSSART